MNTIKQKLYQKIGGMDDIVDMILERIEIDPQNMVFLSILCE